MTEVLIPARQGRAVRVARGTAIDVINTHGTQVVDFWALCSPNTSEHLSMEHTRIAIGRLMPRVGDTLVSNERRPMLTVVADTSPGVHDTLMASCDAERHGILRQRTNKNHIGWTVCGAVGIATCKGLLLKEYAGSREAESYLIHEGVAEVARPVQANLLAQGRNILVVTNVKAVAIIEATGVLLLVDVTAKKIVFLGQLEIDSSRGFVIIEWAGYEA